LIILGLDYTRLKIQGT